MQHLITTNDVVILSRGMSVHVDESKISVYLREAEKIEIKSGLGEALVINIRKKH